jgi:uncharacterized protein
MATKPVLDPKLVLEGIWWNIKSVLFEELIFRGVIFYILIKKFGALPAITISALAFGFYHWFSYEIIGNVQQMIIVFFITGIMGLLYAYGYAKTYSLYIPVAIHFGWNFTQGFVFSKGVIGNGIFISVKKPATRNGFLLHLFLHRIFTAAAHITHQFFSVTATTAGQRSHD